MKTKTQIFTIILTAVITYSCGTRWNNSNLIKDTICLNYTDQISKLPMVLVEDMTQGYRNRQKASIDITYTMNDAQAIWFDLETLKQFIYNIEKSAGNDKANPLRSDDLGIRIYYANYPNKDNWEKDKYNNELKSFVNDPIREKYEHLHTVVMIPTLRKDGVEMDFDPTQPNTYINGLENIGNNSTQLIMALSATSTNSSSQTSIGAQNHGQMHPPYANTGMAFK